MPILVRNLPRDLAESELRNLFSPYGEVSSCDLVMDKNSGVSKGFGFVELVDEDATQKAIKGLNGSRVQEQKIRVKWSNQEKHQTKQWQADSHNTDSNESGPAQANHNDIWASARPRINNSPGEYD